MRPDQHTGDFCCIFFLWGFSVCLGVFCFFSLTNNTVVKVQFLFFIQLILLIKLFRLCKVLPNICSVSI